MTVYTAKIEHSDSTVRSMARAQYDSFRPKSFYLLLILSFLLLYLVLLYLVLLLLFLFLYIYVYHLLLMLHHF